MWPLICANADDDTRERLFNALLAASVIINGGNFESLWAALLDARLLSDDAAERWIRRILDNIEAIESFGNLDGILQSQQLDHLLSTVLRRELLWAQVPDQIPIEVIRQFVQLLYTDGGPRLSRVHDDVVSVLGANRSKDEEDAVVQLVRKARTATIENASQQRTEMRKRLKHPIDDFVILANESD